MNRLEAKTAYRDAMRLSGNAGQLKDTMRYLARNDLFFLLVYVLKRKDADNDFVFARCREVFAEPNGCLDLWSREHYKSTIITFALTIQDILNDPEVTFGIFSFNRPIAKQFLRQIKTEFEQNDELKYLFDDILWADPRKESPKWSEDDGITVRRKGNPKECTVEAWGLIDGQPTSKHFKKRVYDDVVTKESVNTPEMILKVTNAWELSINLGTADGCERYAGTIYHYADTYRVMRDRGVVKVRIHTPTVDGTLEGEPVLWTREVLAEKVKKMGIHTASCQLFMDPKQDNAQGFKQEWLRYWDADRISGMNVYILCDPACEKKDSSDYTVFVVIGLGYDQNYYVIDIIRDRLSLTEKANVLFSLHMKYRPQNVGYEKYGMQSDIQYFQDKMNRENYRFPITPLGGSMPKNDRIKRLIPYFQAGRVYLPSSTPHRIYSGDTVDTAKQFILDEYLAFPFSSHDDQMDALARILDPELSAVFPQGNPVDPYELEKASSGTYDPKRY